MTIYYPTGDLEYYNSFQKDWMLVNGIPRKKPYKFWYDYIAGILKKELKGYKILDAGCGEGLLINTLNNSGIVGFDFWKDRVGIAKKLNPNNLILEASISKIPVKTKCADYSYTCHTLEQCNDIKEKALQELLRVTRKKIIFIEPIYEYSGLIQKRRMNKKLYLKGFIELLDKYEKKGDLEITKIKQLNVSSTPFNRSWLIVVKVLR